MSVLRQIFGPSRKEVWKQLSSELGADFREGGFARPDKVQVHVKDWTLTLDTFAVSTGKATIVFTRMRAPYVNADGFRFCIHRKSIFTALGKMLGMETDSFFAMISKVLPLQRFGQPPEIGGLCTFLASDDSSFMTGAALVIDAGTAVVDTLGAMMSDALRRGGIIN